jgi:hypothetical protein
MFSLSIPDFILTMATGIFVMGLISLAMGIYLLVSKINGNDIRAIASQTAKLAQKGLAEEVAGLVGNASTLVDALNGLVRTAAGIGIFLIITSFGLFAAAYFLAQQILAVH